MVGARIFVALCFVVLGASFVASTALLINEFQGVDWFTMVVAHSHLFFFFPVLGILALFAFYLPSVVFTHLYWNHLPYGRLRFLIGLVVVAVGSYGFARYLDKPPRAIWEVSPAALAADKGAPGRAPILSALADLRKEAQTRVGISNFARNCALDPLMEMPEEFLKERYCFPAKAHLKGAECCQAQKRFEQSVARLQADPARRSVSAVYDQIFLPLKVFFVLVVIAIGGLLAFWRDRIDRHYRELMPRLERGVMIGALAMLFWPGVDYAYQQTANALFGRFDAGLQIRLSLVIAPWALLLLFYFLRRFGKQGEMVGQISGVVIAAVAVLRYEQLNDWGVRILGIGADQWVLAALTALALGGLVALLWLRRHSRYPQAEVPSA
ncbi:MAG: hypothetical protein HC869_11050 [Rhodospirillales bacterium]|nr:hypothetical protein [Rhodospirillales bacterium]